MMVFYMIKRMFFMVAIATFSNAYTNPFKVLKEEVSPSLYETSAAGIVRAKNAGLRMSQFLAAHNKRIKNIACFTGMVGGVGGALGGGIPSLVYTGITGDMTYLLGAGGSLVAGIGVYAASRQVWENINTAHDIEQGLIVNE